jgi:hypothetical protein
MTPTKQIEVFFEHNLHKALHDVLMTAGFDFRVSPDGKVGRDYYFDRKNLHVYLKDIDDEMEPFTDRDGNILTDRDYSDAEWKWMNAKSKTPMLSDEVEFLTRELYILCHVRPLYMTAAQIKKMS